MPNEFGDNRIVRNSELKSLWTVLDKPVWTETFIKTKVLIDELDFLQLGQQSEMDFETVEIGVASPTGQSIWPTKEDPGLYKYNSMWLELK